jgi:hypothetical protein
MDFLDFELCLPPLAPVLLESMRAIGYSFEAALADIVDNSISAGASEIQIKFLPYDSPHVAVLDDGEGMSAEGLVHAMRHGSKDPRTQRSITDLGRFGLGLKTASLSQCRCLTVATISEGTLSARKWDLDVVEQRADWILTGLTEDQLKTLPHITELQQMRHGTLVVWQNFDRLSAGESSIEAALGERIDRAREHLSLVFHRFLGNERIAESISLSINNNPVVPQDPFLSNLKATQPLPEEVFDVEGQKVRVAPFILPHISKLSAESLRIAGGEEGLRRNQGFYIYRNRRLISWGSWFRLLRQEEITKLARVRVDIPNSLDHLWTLDVKKSAAFPPEVVRNRLKVIVERITEGSRRVYTYRGRRANNDSIVHSWDRKTVRGGVAYVINREHPLVSAVECAIPEEHAALFQKFLQTLELNFPFDALYADMASERRPESAEGNQCKDEELYELAARILDAVGKDSESAFRLLQNLGSIEPFNKCPEETKRIVEKLEYVYRERTTN